MLQPTPQGDLFIYSSCETLPKNNAWKLAKLDREGCLQIIYDYILSNPHDALQKKRDFT